jgi:hypothetical protein
MTHVRDQIRDAVLAAVIGLATTKKNAFASRVHPVNDNELPCVLVFTRNESSAPVTQATPRRIERMLTVMVEGYVKLNTGYDDKLDKIAVEVETAIYNSTSLKAVVRDIFLSGTEIKLLGEAEKPLAIVSMSFMAKYYTLENDSQVLI